MWQMCVHTQFRLFRPAMRGLSSKQRIQQNKIIFVTKFFNYQTCPLPCEKNRDCVQCKAFQTGKRNLVEDCDQCDPLLVLEGVPKINADELNKKCQFIDADDNCTFLFSYSITNDKIIKYQQTKECGKSFPTWAIILIIVSGVIAVGLAILITWKILDTMQQKRECARFNEEKKKAAWEMVNTLNIYFTNKL